MLQLLIIKKEKMPARDKCMHALHDDLEYSGMATKQLMFR